MRRELKPRNHRVQQETGEEAGHDAHSRLDAAAPDRRAGVPRFQGEGPEA